MTAIVAGLLVLVGLGGAALAWSARQRRRVVGLRELLDLSYLDAGENVSAEHAGRLLTRSGALAEGALRGTSLLTRLGAVVERSEWRVSAGELVVVSVVGALLAAVIGAVAGGVVLAVLLAGAAAAAPYLLCSRSVRKRQSKFDAQLPGILDLLAASLEGGAGLAQALEVVTSEADEPARTEFSGVLAATRLGTPFPVALRSLAEQIGSRDLRWTVRAIAVQQQTGGRLAEVLRIVSGVMRTRDELRREVSALTAEGRLSAYILTALPVLSFVFMLLVRRTYIHPLYTTVAGLIMLGGAAVLMTVAFVSMRRMARIEV